MKMSRSRSINRGSSLVATLWLIAVLGLVVFAATRLISVDAKLITARKAAAEALARAESGLAIGSHPATRGGDPLLRQEFDDGSHYHVQLGTEEARLNVNELLKRNHGPVLTRLFRLWGLGDAEATALAAALKDWVDADDLAGLNGAERGAYADPRLPMNRPFRSLDEMRQVRGMDRLESIRPDWREAFSLWSEGRIDVNTAAADVLAAAADVDPVVAADFVIARAGVDSQDGTFDDRRFVTVPEALAALRVPPQLMAGLDSLFTVEGRTRRVDSVGSFGHQQKRVVLIQRGGATLWRGPLPVRLSTAPDHRPSLIAQGGAEPRVR